MNDKCAICLEELTSGLGVISSCGHCLHDACWQELKQNHALSENESSLSYNNSTKYPRCPICKHKAKRFVKMYLQLSSGSCHRSTVSTTNPSSTSSLLSSSQDSTVHHESLEDHYKAIHSLSTENFQLKNKMRSLESLSKDQSELLLEVLPKYDALEDQVKTLKIEKAYLESKLEGMEAENAELISDWNMVEIKLQQVQEENQELQHQLKQNLMENGLLRSSRDILAERLAKSMRKRKDMDNTLLLRRTSNDQKRNCQEVECIPQNKNDKSMSGVRAPNHLYHHPLPHHDNTVVSKRRRHRTRERITQEFEMEKLQLKSMLAEANHKTDKLKNRVTKLKRRIHETKRIRGLSV